MMKFSQAPVFNVVRNIPKMVQALGGKPPSTSLEIKPLSDLDNVVGALPLYPFIFFYPGATRGAKTEDPATAIRDGLAKALVAYYPLAGQVYQGPGNKLMVNCKNEGVAFVEADAQVTLEQLGRGILAQCPHIDDLLPEYDRASILNSPILYFQVTRFLCRGFSLGILFNHVLLDGSGLVQFLNAIAEAMKGASTPSIPPVWQREIMNARSPPTITSNHGEYAQSDSDTEQSNDDTFSYISAIFNPEDIQALRNQIHTPASRFDLITACLWKCRTMALELPPNDTVRLIVGMNARFRKGIDIPKGYYGNAAGTISTISKAESLCESPLGYAVNLVQQLKPKMCGEHMRSLVDFLVNECPAMISGRSNFSVSDITRIGFDNIDLGWGKPLHCGTPRADPCQSWYNNFKGEKGEDGVVVPMCLPSSKVEKFRYELHKMTRS